MEVVCTLKEVRIDTYLEGVKSTRTFTNADGDLYLYRINDGDSHLMQMYTVGNDLDNVPGRFPILQCCTLVFEKKVVVRAPDRIITIRTDENTFDFYRRIYRLEGFSVSIDVHRSGNLGGLLEFFSFARVGNISSKQSPSREECIPERID